MKIEFLEDLYFQGLKEKADIQKGLGLPIALVTGAGSVLFYFVNQLKHESSLLFIILFYILIAICSIILLSAIRNLSKVFAHSSKNNKDKYDVKAFPLLKDMKKWEDGINDDSQYTKADADALIEEGYVIF